MKKIDTEHNRLIAICAIAATTIAIALTTIFTVEIPTAKKNKYKLEIYYEGDKVREVIKFAEKEEDLICWEYSIKSITKIE